jgi:hypothetical protein
MCEYVKNLKMYAQHTINRTMQFILFVTALFVLSSIPPTASFGIMLTIAFMLAIAGTMVSLGLLLRGLFWLCDTYASAQDT